MILVVLIFFLLLAVTILFVMTSELVAFVRTRVPFVPTSAADVKFFVEKANIKTTDVFFDLGSGNGKVTFLVEDLTGAKVKGFELGWWTILYAKIKAKIKGSKADFSNKNFFNENWKDASIIYCYLYPTLMARIEKQFKEQTKPGSVAIVRDFPFPNLPHLEKYYMPHNHEIYIYKNM